MFGFYVVCTVSFGHSCSYVLTGTEQGMQETFGTTCHGAVSTYNTCMSELAAAAADAAVTAVASVFTLE